MMMITDREFQDFQRFIYDAAGISLSSAKKALVTGRLARRLSARNLDNYGAYFALLRDGKDKAEVQTAIDLLTTNETYFFREPKHFDLLRKVAAEADDVARGGRPFRVWSAASSTGEEAYSMAMVLADSRGNRPWEVVGTDISTRVVAQARTGHFVRQRTMHIPADYLRRFCLKGIGEQEGTVLVTRELRDRINFRHANLNTTLPELGSFDVIFLRNVMIYFDQATKRKVVERVLSLLRPGGYFCIGHSESLHEISTAVHQIAPATYRKP